MKDIFNKLVTISNNNNILVEEKDIDNIKYVCVTVNEGIENKDLISFLKDYYDLQNEIYLEESKILKKQAENNEVTAESRTKILNMLLNLKDLSINKKIDAIRYSLTREDLLDVNMLLNITSLVRNYNNFSKDFFEAENCYFNKIMDFVDARTELQEELKILTKQLSIYFLSLFKSYNKTHYTPLEKHIELPSLYASLFMSMDILSLSSIFSSCEPFSTDECVYIENGIAFLTILLQKSNLANTLLNDFFIDKEK